MDSLVRNLVDALNGHIPSNMLLYGVPGSGKTVVTRFVLSQLREKGSEMGQPVKTYEINCRNVDTKYMSCSDNCHTTCSREVMSQCHSLDGPRIVFSRLWCQG